MSERERKLLFFVIMSTLTIAIILAWAATRPLANSMRGDTQLKHRISELLHNL